MFEDADPEAYLDQSGGPGGLWYSTGVSGLGSEIQVLASNETTGVMRLKIGARFVAATSEPEIQGTPSVGETLTAVAPEWFQDGVDTEVTWVRDQNPIAGADEREYELTPDDAGEPISVSFTGTKSGYTSTTVASAGVTVPLEALTPTEPLAITGTARVGQTLTAHAAGWPLAGPRPSPGRSAARRSARARRLVTPGDSATRSR